MEQVGGGIRTDAERADSIASPIGSDNDIVDAAVRKKPYPGYPRVDKNGNIVTPEI